MFNKFFKKNKNYLDSKNKNDFLHNVYVLYVVFLLALGDIFYMIQMGDFISAGIFVLIGLLTSFFSKNMVVILCICITATYILKFGSKWKEGFEDSSSKETTEETTEETTDTEETTEETTDTEETTEETTEEQPDINKKIEDIWNSDETTDKNDKNSDMTKKLKKLKKIEKTVKTISPKNINKLFDKQSKVLESLKEYQPLLSTMQNISKYLGLQNKDSSDNSV